MRKRKGGGGLVYSTDSSTDHSTDHSTDRGRQRTAGAADGAVLVSRETKGRKGAGVTLVSGLPLDDKSLNVLAKKLKRACGVGGSVKAGVIELQGEQRDRVVALLEADGIRARRSGG